MSNDFNPDFIIGHKVANEAKLPEEDELIDQLANLIMRPTNYKIPAEDGILLETKFDNVGLMDFNKLESTQMAGLETANNFIDSIKNKIKRRVPVDIVNQKRKEFNAKKPKLLFQNIQVEGVTDPAQRRFIIQSMKHKSNVINIDNFKREYFKLVTDKQIKSMRPTAIFNPETGYVVVHLKVVPQSKMEIKFGGNVSSKPINQGFLGFDYRVFKDRAYTLSSNIYFGRFYSSFKAGARIDFPTKLPFYVAGYSTVNRWDYYSTSTELLFENVKPPYIIQNEYNFRLEAGIPIGVHNKLSGGIAYSNARDEYYQTKTFTKEDDPDKTDFNGIITNIELESNSLNYKQYATQGFHKRFSGKLISGKENNYPGSTSTSTINTSENHNYFLLEGFVEKYFRLGSTFTLGVQAEGVFSNKSTFNNYTSTVLAAPGYTPTPHSKAMFIENFHANKYVAGGLMGVFNLNDQLHLRLEGHYFSPIREIEQTEHLNAEYSNDVLTNFYFQGMGALVYHTGLGPVSFSVNYYDKQDAKYFVMLNFGYILFNKRGL